MIKHYICTILMMLGCLAYANDLTLTIKTDNKTADLKDGQIQVLVNGGRSPYTYFWSHQQTSQNEHIAKGLIEGKLYHLKVVDANGLTIEKTLEVPARSRVEAINAWFTPLVEAIGRVFMFDPFAYFNLYDSILYDEKGKALTFPNGEKQTTSIPFIVIWLVLGALFFTIKMKFINFSGMKHAFDLVRGKFDKPGEKGEVSHFQALVTALSGTVGLGNIVGVSVAISLGGAGATFWMICAGLLGMSSKFVECSLGVKYRKILKNKEVSGGPMYYLRDGLAKKNKKYLGKILAFLFAILCIGGSLGGGNMFQANQAFAQAKNLEILSFLEGNGFYFGLFMAIISGIVIVGGIKSIAKVTDKIVPFMVGAYVLSALIIIGMNIENLTKAFSEILNGAFNPDALKGGVIGVLIVGFQRAAFSNEAGIGSASIAHSAVKTDEHISEGIVSTLEPFIDTVVVCTMTALVLIFTGYAADTQGLEGAALTTAAFESTLGSGASYILTFSCVLFAFSTIISWSYYGVKSWTYLFGEKKWVINCYKLMFLVFTIIGASSSLGAVIDFSDYMILGMAFPNIFGLYFFAGEIKNDMKMYFAKIKNYQK